MTKEILNIKEIAKYLSCSVSTIRNMIRKNEIPYFRIGVKYYFRKESIVAWIIENEKK